MVNFALAPEPTAVGTGTISGKVTDVNTGRKISGVLFQTDTGQSAKSKNGGTYTIKDVPEGVREVTASKDGYDTETLTVTVTAGGTAGLNFVLVR